MFSSIICTICSISSGVSEFSISSNGKFYECEHCEFLFYVSDSFEDATVLNTSNYEDSYWHEELDSSRDRAYGVSLARAAEVFILARRPIRTFLDIGTGPGYFLDAISRYLPDSKTSFLGVELFPPRQEFQTSHPGYRTGWLEQFSDGSVDGGMCIEVLEHLTPIEVKELFRVLFLKATSDSAFIFNTGLIQYVKNEDLAYLDPIKRGHISIWSVNAIRRLLAGTGWSVTSIPNRTWAFLVEKDFTTEFDLSNRIWEPLPENVQALCGDSNSKVLFLLGRDSLRAI